MRMRQLFGAKNGGCNQVNARVGFVLIKPVRFSEFFWCTFISTSIYGVIEGNDCPKLDFEESVNSVCGFVGLLQNRYTNQR